MRRRAGDGGGGLSPREETIVRLVAQGVPDPVIAAHLGIGEDRVRNHRAKVFKKLAWAGLLERLTYVGGDPPNADC
jgi:DNA-binding CsgD family transcriptional regulator